MDNVVEVEIAPGPGDGAYVVRVLRSVTGGEPVAVAPLDVSGIAARRAHLESAVLSSAVPARRIAGTRETLVREVGQQLFETVFSGPVAGAYRASQGVAQERGGDVQVLLRLSAPELAALPWETLFDPESGAFVCRREPVVRHVPAPFTPDPLTIRHPLRILAAVASPSGLPRLDVAGEQERLTEALRPHVVAGRAELVWLPDVTWYDLHAALLSGEWHVLHFIGHGDYDAATDEGVLAFTGPDGRAEPVEAGALADLLGEAEPTPRLVVLNSCLSGAAGSVDPFSGTAAALVRRGIHAVVAMQFAISDGAALAFARAFYTALASGRPVDESVRSGRIGILGSGRGTLEWVTPVLYVRGGSADVFRLTGGGPRHPTPADPAPPPVAAAAPEADPAAPGAPSRDAPRATTPVRDVPPGAHAAAGGLEADTHTIPHLASAPPLRVRTGVRPADEAAHTGAVDALDADPPDETRSTETPVARRSTGLTRGAWIGLAAAVAAVGLWAALVLPGDAPGDGATDATATTPVTPDPAVSVTVPGYVLWTDSTVDCAAFDLLQIRASGTVMHEPTPQGAVTPDGLTDPVYHQYNVPGLPDANTVALIGRIGIDGDPWVVGTGTDHVCDEGGRLFLGINDVGVDNNSGEFLAVVTRVPRS